MPQNALIFGAGSGLSASCARALSSAGYRVTLTARNPDKLGQLSAEIGAKTMSCDVVDPSAVADVFAATKGDVAVVIANPSARAGGPIETLDPEAVRRSVEITGFGSFTVGQAAAKRMLTQAPTNNRRGTILFTGASAGEKGFARSAAFGMGKFAQRGLAQSMARELHPQGIHCAWINIDGGIRNPERAGRMDAADNPDSMLDPDAIARTYMHLIEQDRTAWTNEVAVRPWVERF